MSAPSNTKDPSITFEPEGSDFFKEYLVVKEVLNWVNTVTLIKHSNHSIFRVLFVRVLLLNKLLPLN